jgi:riboflavin kinase/FMN adenylyltransferase
VLTFDPHPLKVIRPEAAPLMLTSTPHKTRILDSLGIEGCLVMPFTKDLRNQEPEDFVRLLCNSGSQLEHIVVGTNWTFGHEHRGSADLLQSLAAECNISATIVPPVQLHGEPVSSTRVRRAVKQGRLPEVAEMLGRHFSVWGRVVEGDKIGRELGFPTANIDPHNEVHLPNGVYAVYAMVGEKRYDAASYIGERPTFDVPERQWVVEVYLLDVSLELYGEDVEVFFVSRLRGDERFENVEELKAQIERDIDETRRVLTSTHDAV